MHVLQTGHVRPFTAGTAAFRGALCLAATCTGAGGCLLPTLQCSDQPPHRRVFALPAARRPQLCINVVYLNTMGFEDADPIAIFSFVMSIFSLLFNFGLGYKEVKALKEAGETIFPAFV